MREEYNRICKCNRTFPSFPSPNQVKRLSQNLTTLQPCMTRFIINSIFSTFEGHKKLHVANVSLKVFNERYHLDYERHHFLDM